MKANLKILLVEDSAAFRGAVTQLLGVYNDVSEAESMADARRALASGSFDVVVLDKGLPDGDGIQVMNNCRKIISDLPCIMLTGYATINTAIEATKQGAFDFIQKPFEKSHLLVSVRNAIDLLRLKRQNEHLKSEQEDLGFEKMVGSSQPLLNVIEVIKKVADSDSTVLITGESGTGKELIARAIHQRSKRKNHLLIPINCGAIPADLLESELFGHVKGAFTGAISTRIGRFEVADGGTIFLDEIGEMSPALQVKLLRVLQEQCFEPVGSTRTVHVDVRIIAATNQNLEELISLKEFREDLFYRLNVIPITAPPLRDRVGDVPILCHFFLDKFNQQKERQITGFETETLELLKHYHWPGNVRELENLIERIVILKGEGIVSFEDLPDKIRDTIPASVTESNLTAAGLMSTDHLPEKGVSFNHVVNSFENNLILQALDRTHWNRNKAAKLLGLNRTTLVEKIKKKGLKPPQDDPESSISG